MARFGLSASPRAVSSYSIMGLFPPQCTSGSVATTPAIPLGSIAPTNGLARPGARSTLRMAAFPTPHSPRCSFPAPDKSGGRPIPPTCGRFQPVNDLLRSRGVLPIQGPPHQNALHGFGHIEPTASQRRVQGHDAMGKEGDASTRAYDGQPDCPR